MTFAFIFSDVGFGEWFVLLAVILVVVGPKRLPETARKFGNWYSKFRRAADSFKRQLMDMDTEFERAVSEAEQQANDAFTVEDEAKKDEAGDELKGKVEVEERTDEFHSSASTKSFSSSTVSPSTSDSRPQSQNDVPHP